MKEKDNFDVLPWWAQLHPNVWRYHDPDPLRPTENEAFQQIAFEAYVRRELFFKRLKEKRRVRYQRRHSRRLQFYEDEPDSRNSAV